MDDDEFGDLYTDVLRPFAPSIQSQADSFTPLRSRPVDQDVNSDDGDDDGGILHGPADPKNSISKSDFGHGAQLNASVPEKTLQAQPESGPFDSNSEIAGSDGLNSEKGEGVRIPENGPNFIVEDDDLNIVAEEGKNKGDDDLVEKDVNLVEKPENMYVSAEQKESADIYADQGVVGKMGSEHIIPGLSGKIENHEGPNFVEEWDTDESEDDLQIVLNDNNHGPMGMMERMPLVDGEGEDGEDGERLVIVADNGDVGHPHHQQPMLDEQEWKGEEVGPGADGERKESGDTTKAGGVPLKIGYSNHLYHHPFHSQFKYVRPGAVPSPGAVPTTPGGIQGQVRPPISMGPGAGRGRGDWRPRGPIPMQKGLHTGNGMPVWGPNTAGRGYGSGLDFTLPSHKTIFEVDIDGFEEKPWRHPGINISDFFNFGFIEDSWKAYCKQLELLRLEKTMQGKIHVYESGRTEQDYNRELPPELAAAVGNQDVPSENANVVISVEGSSDLARSSARVPPPVPIGRPIPVETSSDDRRERLPSIDTRRPRMHDSDAIIEIVCQSFKDDDVEELVSDSDGEDLGGPDDIDDLRRDGLGDPDEINRYSRASNDQKREIVAKREKLVSRDETERQGEPPEIRSTKGRGQAKSSKINTSDDYDDDGKDKQSRDNHNESCDSDHSNPNPLLSSYRPTESNKDQSMAVGDDDVTSRSFDPERENFTTNDHDAPEDGKTLRHPPNKQIAVESRADQLSQEKDEGEEDSKASRKSIDDRSRDSVKRRAVNENNDRTKSRHHVSGKEREDYFHSQRGGPLPNSSPLHRHMKNENTDWRKRIRECGGEIGSGSHQSRSQLDNGSRAGAVFNQDKVGSRQRDRDVAHNKIRKEHGEKEEVTYSHRESVNNSYRKRERDDDMNHLVGKKKEEGLSNQERGRDEWHNRNKQSREDILPRREKEETRSVMRTMRPVDDKKWASHSRGRDEYKGSGREHRSENASRHNDQPKRRDRVEDEGISRSGGHEKPGTSDEPRQEGSRKGKESESGEQGPLIPSKRNRDEQSGRISDTVNPKSITKGTNVESDNHVSRRSSRKHTRDALDGDEQTTTDSRRGRSKLERWTSHLERDFKSLSSSSKKTNKGPDTHNSSGEAALPSRKVDEDDKDTGGGEKNNANAKTVEDNNNTNIHLDTVERLKKRSKRFKLPMPSENEALATKKIVREPLASTVPQTESRPGSEIKIKPDRPARKRRWTGN